MKRAVWCLLASVLLVACSSGPKAAPGASGGSQGDSQRRVVAIEAALKEHKASLLGQRGVLFVGVGQAKGSQERVLVVRVAGPSLAAALELPQVDVPVEVVTVGEDPAPDACVYEGGVYASGTSIPVECNKCRCEEGQVGMCTLLGCELRVLEQVFFTEGVQMDPAQEKFAASLASQLADYPMLMLVPVGHASEGEADPVGLGHKRAQVVAGLLKKGGINVPGVKSEGASQPRDPQTPEHNRRVTFEVAALTFDYGSYEVTPKLAERLEVLASLLKEAPRPVVLQGFGSTREGDASSQLWLGEARARAVRDFLLKQGVPAEKLQAAKGGVHQAPVEAKKDYLQRYVVVVSP